MDGNGELTAYGYDNKYRLTSAFFFQTAAFYTYTYDAVDNRTFSSESGSPVTYTYNPAGQITTSIDISASITSYTYDLNGNNTLVAASGARSTMSYDQENRLTAEVDGSTFTSYTYEPGGMKRSEIAGSAITTLLWDSSDYLQGRG